MVACTWAIEKGQWRKVRNRGDGSQAELAVGARDSHVRRATDRRTVNCADESAESGLAEPDMQTVLIRVEPSGEQWLVKWFEDHGNEGWTSLPSERAIVDPIAEAELARIRTQVLEETGSSPEFETIGHALYGLLATGAVATRWSALAESNQRRMRVMLDIRSDALSKLPWELMRHEAQLFATNVESPIVRVANNFPGQGQLSPIRWPLRLMVVIGSEPNDKDVSAEEELAGLRGALRTMCGLLDIEVLHQPTRQKLREIYRQHCPHIFHFIGHGDVEEKRGRLKLFDADRDEYVPWRATEIGIDLAGWQPRLAILNACRTSSLEKQNGAWEIAATFTQLGASAVVAMQADIRGDSAAAFAHGLYSALADGRSLDVAVANGRARITQVVGVGVDRRDFGLPSLTVSAPPADILRTRFCVAPEFRPSVESNNRRLWAFVDRAAERRRLWRRIDPEPEELHREEDGVRPPAITIVGGSHVGKTELARWCVGTCQLHGGNAVYVDLKRDQRLHFVQTLHVIREALVDATEVHTERNASAFGPWLEALDGLGRGVNGDDARPWPPDALEIVFTMFGDALRAAAGDRPLLIALDHTPDRDDESWKFVCDRLLARVARHRLSPVRLLVALSEEQHRSGSLGDEIHDIAPRVELRRFAASEFKSHADWYLSYHYEADLDAVDRATTTGAQLVPSEWDWSTLEDFARFLAGRDDWRPRQV